MHFAVALAQHRRRLKLQQMPDRVGGLRLRAPFEQLAEQHQRDHRPSPPRNTRAGRKSECSQTATLNAYAAVVPSATSTSMFAAPPRNAFHAPAIEAGAGPELHGRRKRELQPHGHLDLVPAGDHERHLRDERRGQQRGERERRQVAAIAAGLLARLVLRLRERIDGRRGVVAGLAHRARSAICGVALPASNSTRAVSVAKLTAARTPSARFSTFSIRAAHAAQVIPVSWSSIVRSVIGEYCASAISDAQVHPYLRPILRRARGAAVDLG